MFIADKEQHPESQTKTVLQLSGIRKDSKQQQQQQQQQQQI
jgi:hypothetical protein